MAIGGILSSHHKIAKVIDCLLDIVSEIPLFFDGTNHTLLLLFSVPKIHEGKPLKKSIHSANLVVFSAENFSASEKLRSSISRRCKISQAEKFSAEKTNGPVHSAFIIL
jgi:hypothetical protein